MKALSIVIISLLIGGFAFSQDKGASKATGEDKKIYSEKEFHDALVKAIEEKLIKVGNAKIVEFSKELLERERQLELREQAIKNREASLGELNTDFANQVKEFGQKQSKFLSCLDETEKKEENRLTHMVDVISGMKPQNAADVLSVQDATISVKILGELAPTKVSKIFNLMDKEISARLQKQYLTMKK